METFLERGDYLSKYKNRWQYSGRNAPFDINGFNNAIESWCSTSNEENSAFRINFIKV